MHPLGHWYLNEAATSARASFSGSESGWRTRGGEIEGVGGIVWIDKKKKILNTYSFFYLSSQVCDLSFSLNWSLFIIISILLFAI